MILELGNYKATHFLRIQKDLLINISFAYTEQLSPALPSVNFALTNGWKTTSLPGDLFQAAILDSPQTFTDACVLIKVHSSVHVHIVMKKKKYKMHFKMFTISFFSTNGLYRQPAVAQEERACLTEQLILFIIQDLGNLS